jgi:predicted secreted protein
VLSFASYLIFAIPLDIACAKRSDSMQLPYDMNFVWSAINFAIAFIIIFVLPMAMILYSDDNDDFKETVKSALKISAVIAAIHLVFVIFYLLVVNVAEVPVKHIAKTTMDFITSDRKINTLADLKTFYGNTSTQSNSVAIKLGFLNSFTLHLVVLGSFLLICLEGYGLALFPMEFLNAFLNRPQIRDPEDFVLTKFILREENEKIANEAKRVKKMKEELDRSTGFLQRRSKQMQYSKDVSELKKVFLEFEEVMECFKQEDNMQDVNPLVHYGYLIVGCVAYVASFMIIFHM